MEGGEKMNKFKKVLAVTTLVCIATIGLAPVVNAGLDEGIIDTGVGGEIGYDDDSDLKATITNIVQWALGFLALIAVIMIIVGGFMWMTAGGNEERVEKAKKMISAAVIGLIIILLAWAIVIFVIGVIEEPGTNT